MPLSKSIQQRIVSMLVALSVGLLLQWQRGAALANRVRWWWKMPGQVRDYHQTWDYEGNPTTFRNYGMCLGSLPGNSRVRRLDCASGSAVVWHR